MSGPAVPHLRVVKVGGSLLSDGARLRALLADLATGADGPAVVVPGGGPFADAVRRVQNGLGLDDGFGHRLALDAMGRTARVFQVLEPRLAVIEDLPALAPAARRRGGAVVWDPAALREGMPGIPEDWSVTSDSLALWLAARLGAADCTLHKSAPAPAGADPEDLARRGYVDAAFPVFARAFGGAITFAGPAAARSRRAS